MKLDVHLTSDDLATALRHDALVGLTADPKWLPPKWFYDEYGSELFEKITVLPEYYPTRAEREALVAYAPEIAGLTQAATIVELGSGSSEKTRVLLDALTQAGTLRRFIPLDVSDSALRAAALAIDADYPDLAVHAVAGDFTTHLRHLPPAEGRLVAFLGGTVGNFLPGERIELLGQIRQQLHAGEWLLLGTDLVKDPATLIAAYNDDAGVTADFNLNVLRVLNRELGANFDIDLFSHVAAWDAEREWIEMRLRADRDLVVRIPELELTVAFAAGEELRTEISAKFRRERVTAELATIGFAAQRWWTDAEGRFALTLARAE